MGFFDRLSRLLRANVNDLVSKAEDPVNTVTEIPSEDEADPAGPRRQIKQGGCKAPSAQLARHAASL